MYQFYVQIERQSAVTFWFNGKDNASISKKLTCNFTSLQTPDGERHLFEEKKLKIDKR